MENTECQGFEGPYRGVFRRKPSGPSETSLEGTGPGSVPALVGGTGPERSVRGRAWEGTLQGRDARVEKLGDGLEESATNTLTERVCRIYELISPAFPSTTPKKGFMACPPRPTPTLCTSHPSQEGGIPRNEAHRRPVQRTPPPPRGDSPGGKGSQRGDGRPEVGPAAAGAGALGSCRPPPRGGRGPSSANSALAT